MKHSDSLTIGDYESSVFNAIKNDGGKLGLLKYISGNEDLRGSLLDIGVIATPFCSPIIVGKDEINQQDFDLLFDRYNRMLGMNDGPGNLISGRILFRTSVPGDIRSLVDILPTTKIDKLDKGEIKSEISRVKERIIKIQQYIDLYADGTGVPFSLDSLKIGIVPEFNLRGLITVTEDPNSDRVFIDTDNLEECLYGKNISSETYPFKKSFTGNLIIELIKILREKKVLDEKVAYQFEIGQLYNNYVLFQIKEFAKKIPVQFDTKGFPGIIGRILSGFNEGELSVPIIVGKNAEDGFKDILNERSENLGLVLPENFHAVSPSHYSPKVNFFAHGDNHYGVFNHNSSRMSMAALQKGGLVILGPSNSMGFSTGDNLKAESKDGIIKVFKS